MVGSPLQMFVSENAGIENVIDNKFQIFTVFYVILYCFNIIAIEIKLPGQLLMSQFSAIEGSPMHIFPPYFSIGLLVLCLFFTSSPQGRQLLFKTHGDHSQFTKT